MRGSMVEYAHFSFNKCRIHTHNGASMENTIKLYTYMYNTNISYFSFF